MRQKKMININYCFWLGCTKRKAGYIQYAEWYRRWGKLGYYFGE